MSILFQVSLYSPKGQLRALKSALQLHSHSFNRLFVMPCCNPAPRIECLCKDQTSICKGGQIEVCSLHKHSILGAGLPERGYALFEN